MKASDGSLRAQAARFQLNEDGKPRNVRIASFEIDVAPEAGAPTGGEYFPVIFLRNGGLAVVTTIQDRPAKRFVLGDCRLNVLFSAQDAASCGGPEGAGVGRSQSATLFQQVANVRDEVD